MFATLKSFLFRKNQAARPAIRRTRLGVETLEAREVPAACAYQQHTYTGLEGIKYEDKLLATYTIQGNSDLSKDDYWVSYSAWRLAEPELELKGRTLTVKGEINSYDEGPHNFFYSIIRKRDNKCMVSSKVTLNAGNAPISNMASFDVSAAHGQETGWQLMATFFDSHPTYAAEGNFTAKIDGGINKPLGVKILQTGQVIQVYGNFNLKNTGNIALGYPMTVTLMESNGGQWAPGSQFCSKTRTVTDANGSAVQVGGMASVNCMVWVAPAKWYETLFAEKSAQAVGAIQSTWAGFTRDAKDAARDLWKSFGNDAIANQKILVNTVSAVLNRLPTANSSEWRSLMTEALKLVESQPGRTLNQIAYDLALNKLVSEMKSNLAPIGVLPGVTTLSNTGGVAGLDPAVRKLAEPAAKLNLDRTMLDRYLKANRALVNPGKATDDTSTLSAARLTAVLNATTPVTPGNPTAAGWQSLEGVRRFGAEMTGKDLNPVLNALPHGSTFVLHAAPSTGKPNGSLLNGIKLNGIVYLYDAQTGLAGSLGLTTKYQLLDTTV